MSSGDSNCLNIADASYHCPLMKSLLFLLVPLISFILFRGTIQSMAQGLSSGNMTGNHLAPGQNNPFWPVDQGHQDRFISAITGAVATYHNGVCIHPTNASLAAACDGFETGAISTFLQDIIENNSKHRLVQAQQKSFGRGFYDGYAAAWAIANATLPKHNSTSP